MLRSVGVLAGAAIALGCAAAKASDDPYEPTGEHYQVIYECLEASRDAQRREIEHGCVGIVAKPCLDNPDHQHTHGMAGCVRREEIIWDALLNDWYGMARENLSKNLQIELRNVQRVWIKWRDAKCGFEHAKFEGGTMGIPVSASCTMEATARRALELRGLVGEFEAR